MRRDTLTIPTLAVHKEDPDEDNGGAAHDAAAAANSQAAGDGGEPSPVRLQLKSASGGTVFVRQQSWELPTPVEIGCGDVTFGSHAGRVGLKNLGNSCFMNAGLQCLSHLEPLVAYFLNSHHEEDVNRVNPKGCKGHLSDAFAELQRALWLGDSRIHDPAKFRQQISGFAPHLFQDYNQEDIQEFLAFCLDGLHEDLNRVLEPAKPLGEAEVQADRQTTEGRPESFAAGLAWMRHLQEGQSFLVDLLQGQWRSSLTCTECGHISRSFEPFLYLSVPVTREMKHLTEAIEKHLEEELLSGSDQWHCECCDRRVDAKKKIDLWMLPPVLVLHLKRFEFLPADCAFRKITAQLQVPDDMCLDLSSYCSAPQRQGASYEVVCVANHRGQYGAGHYTVIFLVRHSTKGGDYTNGHCAPLIRRQTVKLPELWPHRLSKDIIKEITGRRQSVRLMQALTETQSPAQLKNFLMKLPTELLPSQSSEQSPGESKVAGGSLLAKRPSSGALQALGRSLCCSDP
eukprot:TRINITY_DN11213_c0_g1_i1.p1 TRINITY_DN11213_c0_g1~~TRINITY_DN11213_c0_g1_i1.p1  ORF type:complete len:513 (-),score=132.39 TRINITY_DN11213_c0_g1_i1:191-1729(-)